MVHEVENFIKRRFPQDCNWLNGNCFYFALILQERFGGEIYYDPIEGHFFCKIKNKFYDWRGSHKSINIKDLILWKNYKQIDSLHWERIWRDVVG